MGKAPVYLITYTFLFWVPSALFLAFFYRKIDAALKIPFWLTCLLMAAVSVVMEWLFLRFDVWFFSQKVDVLAGIWFGRAPIEEFVFWFGATPFCLSIYLSFRMFFERKNA